MFMMISMINAYTLWDVKMCHFTYVHIFANY